ncbi:MAG: UDP-2,3-diacylglucosamine diphosphatase [Gammaproteobacteria bacterium]
MQNKQLFISDLHLCAERPASTALFLKFLEQDARHCAALYILGDLFEAWLGDDDTHPESLRVMAALRRVTDHGVLVYIMHGNRDFLIGSGFETMTGCRLLPDPCVIHLYDEPTLLMHGDTLCTQDTEYQTIRLQVRDPAWQQALLALPLAQRVELARRYRLESQEKMRNKSEAIMDVDQAAVETIMREHGVRRLIHGHTHRPAVHDFYIDGEQAQRIVLGDWYEQGSALWCDAGGCELQQLPLSLAHEH